MLITNEYRRLNEKLHNTNEHYGKSGHSYADEVLTLANGLKTQDVLDYGCGKCTLANCLPFIIKKYDPAIRCFNEEPEPADLVVCTDVLEHIEPELLDNVLADIHAKTKQMAFLVAAIMPAKKTLEDGRNAHLIIQKPEWWFSKLSEKFEILKFSLQGRGCHFVVKPVIKTRLQEGSSST